MVDVGTRPPTETACRTCQPFRAAHRFSLRPTSRSPFAPMANDPAVVRIPSAFAVVTRKGCWARSSLARVRADSPGVLRRGRPVGNPARSGGCRPARSPRLVVAVRQTGVVAAPVAVARAHAAGMALILPATQLLDAGD